MTKGVAQLGAGSLGQGNQDPLKLGAALIMTIPVAALFLVFQRRIMDASPGAVKERGAIRPHTTGLVLGPTGPSSASGRVGAARPWKTPTGRQTATVAVAGPVRGGSGSRPARRPRTEDRPRRDRSVRAT